MSDLQDAYEAIIPRLVRMEEKLDGYLFRTTRLENRADDSEHRIRSLENGNSRLLAGCAVVAFLISSGSDVVRALLT
jgi:hypothetical protein